MSIFARADVAGVSVSPEHGGCGVFHSRPVVQGAPVALWQLDCPACEDYLRSDPLWSANVTQIPETPDEVAQHEDWKRKSEKDTQFLLALALAKMAEVDVPDSMRRSLAGKAAITGSVLCPGGHEQAAGSRFCSECGAGMSGAPQLPAAPASAAAPADGKGADQGSAGAGEDNQGADGSPFETWKTAPAETELETTSEAAAEEAGGSEPVDLDSMTLAQLRALAAERGVAAARSKADQIGALRRAGL